MAQTRTLHCIENRSENVASTRVKSSPKSPVKVTKALATIQSEACSTSYSSESSASPEMGMQQTAPFKFKFSVINNNTNHKQTEPVDSHANTEIIIANDSNGGILGKYMGEFSAVEDTNKWCQGSLVWAKMRSFPWWPAIIKQNMEGPVKYMKMGKVSTQAFSVLFIDDGRFAWVRERDITIFNSLKDFEEMKNNAIEKLRTLTKSKLYLELRSLGFVVEKRPLVQWNRSVKLAEEAKSLDNQQRLDRLITLNGKYIQIAPKDYVPPLPRPTKISLPSSTPQRKSRPSKRKLSMSENMKQEKAVKKEKKESAREKEPVLSEKSVVACLTNDPICEVCCGAIEDETPDVCTSCQSTLHKICHKQENVCDTCATGVRICNLCKGSGNVNIECSVSSCNKTYHNSCATQQRLADDSPRKLNPNKYRCSLHVCHTCLAHDKREEAGKGRILHCLLCAVGYHMRDSCIPAGCSLLSNKYLVCPKHLNSKDAAMSVTHVNFDACFDCGKGGALLCCEQCPLSYHQECLKLDSPPDKWLCVDCRIGKFPMFNDICWVKYGQYRWWPCVVLHPLQVPDNVENRGHSVGEFVIRFLGSKDYAYVSHGRVFSFSERDSATKVAQSSKHSKQMDKAFSRALVEAKELSHEMKVEKEAIVADEQINQANVLPKYKALTCNKKVSKVGQSRVALEDYPVCSCKSDECCADDRTCANRAMQIECHPELCKAECKNQRFIKSSIPQLTPFQTKTMGWGLRSLNFINKGDFVCEYMGEIISGEEVKSRWETYSKCERPQFYFLTLDSKRVIDAGPSGNVSRFINHSCEPNLISLVWQVFDDIRIGLFASKNIYPGDELSFHYNLDSLDAEVKIPCHCGTKSCIGYIGKRKSKKIEFESAKSKKMLKKKVIKFKREKQCFRCKQNGEQKLFACGKKGCPKVYHSVCLGPDSPPRGRWFCPWHYCGLCEKVSQVFCSKCDSSFCAKHHIENVTVLQDNTVICNKQHVTM